MQKIVSSAARLWRIKVQRYKKIACVVAGVTGIFLAVVQWSLYDHIVWPAPTGRIHANHVLPLWSGGTPSSFPSMTPAPEAQYFSRNFKPEKLTTLADQFPFILYDMTYEPGGDGNFHPSGRPLSLSRSRIPGARYEPAVLPGFLKVWNPKNRQGKWEVERSLGSFVAAGDIAYDISMYCEQWCDARVYSQHTGMRYDVTFPGAASRHAYALVRKIDETYVRHNSANTAFIAHYRSRRNDKPWPDDIVTRPPVCSGPAYRERVLRTKIRNPAGIAIDGANQLYVLNFSSTSKDLRFRINRFPAGQSADGPPSRDAQVRFADVRDIAIGPSGQLLVLAGGFLWEANGQPWNAPGPRDSAAENAPEQFNLLHVMGRPVNEVRAGQTGALFFADSLSGEVYKTAGRSWLGRVKAVRVGSVVYRGEGLAISPAGEVFITGGHRDSIYKFGRDGKKILVADGLREPGKLAFDQAGALYATDASATPLRKLLPDGTECAVKEGIADYSGLTVGGDGTVYVTSLVHGTITAFIPVK